MAQSWITEVSMEVDASEASQIQNPPLPPPVTAPPPYLGQPPSTTHVPSNTHVPDRTGAVPDGTGAAADRTGAIATIPAPASGFYQDPYSSFSQYGAAQQTDPQVRKLPLLVKCSRTRGPKVLLVLFFNHLSMQLLSINRSIT